LNRYIDPTFTEESLSQFQGYSLQAFASGRYKLSFHLSNERRLEYYGEKPRRFKEAYQKQCIRSRPFAEEHFAIVDGCLYERAGCLIHRLHLKGDNNATADNAHVITDTESEVAHLVLGVMQHQWVLPTPTIRCIMQAEGPRTGTASVFNEYLPAYEHDWGDAAFDPVDYRKGHRPPVERYSLHHKYQEDDDLF